MLPRRDALPTDVSRLVVLDTYAIAKLPDKPLRVIRRRAPRAIRLSALSTLLLGPAGMVMADSLWGWILPPLAAYGAWRCWKSGDWR